MTAFQCSSRASTTAHDSSGLPGPVPAVKEAPTIATVGSRRGTRLMRASQAARGAVTVSPRVFWSGLHGSRWISTEETARDPASPAPRPTSQSDNPRQQASAPAAIAVTRPFALTPIA